MKKKDVKVQNNDLVLICKKTTFYSLKDEDAFFESIKKIDCIEKFEGVYDELHLYIACLDLHDEDLRDLIALFYRYKIRKMNQLAIFLNKDNKKWFYDNKNAFWHKKIFGGKKIEMNSLNSITQ